MGKTQFKNQLACYHCGDDCPNQKIHIEEKYFCCNGCKTVFELLSENNLCTYYDLNQKPGISPDKNNYPTKFSYLDNVSVQQKLIAFTNGIETHVMFSVPKMHCSSCIYLLENFHRICPGVKKSTVNFLERKVNIVFNPSETSLRKLVEWLDRIGYEPHISLENLDNKEKIKTDRSSIYKIGIAGFCFANIMMLSFPEYFSMGKFYDTPQLKPVFTGLNLFLSLPVLLYSATGFFISAWKSLRQKHLNIDLPIALAIVVTFCRSVYEITSGTGAGYLDSMTGIVFFMLIGRFFQNRTLEVITFNNGYKSYFPVSVTIKNGNTETNIPVNELKEHQIIKIRNQELIPADSVLLSEKANMDYSFVTGESEPVMLNRGDIVYAGARIVGAFAEMEVINKTSQSYLVQLWNNSIFRKKEEGLKQVLLNNINQYFTITLLGITLLVGIYWSIMDMSRFWNAITSILIVACPCALLISGTFTYGNILRILRNNGFYLKNSDVIEKLAATNTVVFDKTGTITQNGKIAVQYEGRELHPFEATLIHSLASQSNHPLSKMITGFLDRNEFGEIESFIEVPGSGLEGIVNGVLVKIGSKSYVDSKNILPDYTSTTVYFSLEDMPLGCFVMKNEYRKGLNGLVSNMKKYFPLFMLSGDNKTDQYKMEGLFGTDGKVFFQQKPEQKLEKIKLLQTSGHSVMMVGDGLNDAGALKQSDVGIAVSDNVNNFSPACDAILDGESFNKLYEFWKFAKAGKKIVIGSFAISLVYNLLGLYFAVQGLLKPVIAAILMPSSTITIILFTTLATAISAKRLKLKAGFGENKKT